MRVRLPTPLTASGGGSWDDEPAACVQRATAGLLVLRVVLRRHFGGSRPARDFADGLLESRYRPLVRLGELTAPAAALRGLAGLCGGLDSANADAAEAYSNRVSPLLSGITGYQPIWLANFVEYVALNSSPLDSVAPFLEELVACL